MVQSDISEKLSYMSEKLSSPRDKMDNPYHMRTETDLLKSGEGN